MSGGSVRRGWGAVAGLVLVTGVVSVVQPTLLIFVPLSLLLLSQPPRRPVRFAVILMLGALAYLMSVVGVLLAGAVPDQANLLWYFGRGWSLVLGAWFVVMLLLLPDARFLTRGLSALAAALATASAFLLLNRGGLAQLDAAVGTELRTTATQALTAWSEGLGFERVADSYAAVVYGAADLQVEIYPALLALGSLAGLAVAWWGFARLTRRQTEPLLPLREFRFRDELVWLFIGGLVLLLLPLGAWATRAGENLLAFMAVLYALRGVAVLVMVGGVPGPLGLVLGGVLVLFLYPLVMAATVVVGLSDTWLDIRSRRAASSGTGR